MQILESSDQVSSPFWLVEGDLEVIFVLRTTASIGLVCGGWKEGHGR